MATIRAATWDDLDATVELLRARAVAAFGTSELEASHVRSAWESPSFEVGRDNVVAVENGRLVGYAALDARQELEHAARDGAVGDELLARIESRARERGLDRIVTTVVPQDEPLHALVTRNGFVLEREIWRMWLPLDGDPAEPAWPDGVVVRTYRDDDAQRVHDLLDDAYGGWDDGYVRMSHDDWLQFMTADADFDPALWFLVERDGELVAVALHWREHRGDGWVKDIAVRESERGRGLGKALLLHAAREYARRGATRVGLKVDSTNPTGAPRLYERVGFAVDRRYGTWRKPL